MRSTADYMHHIEMVDYIKVMACRAAHLQALLNSPVVNSQWTDAPYHPLTLLRTRLSLMLEDFSSARGRSALIVDVGANVGQSLRTPLFLSTLAPKRNTSIVLFEPRSDHLAELERARKRTKHAWVFEPIAIPQQCIPTA